MGSTMSPTEDGRSPATPPSGMLPEYMTPLSPTGYLMTAIYLTCVGTIATLGNISVIYVLCRYGTFRKRSINLLLINMAASDLGVSVAGYPLTTLSGYSGRWLFGDVGCGFYAFCVYTFSCSTICTHAVIAIYRYVYIVKVDLRSRLTTKFTYWVIGGIWVYSLFWTITPFLGWSSYVFEPFGTSCSINWLGRSISDISYMVMCTVGVYLVQIVIMLYCYFGVAKRIRGIDPQRTEGQVAQSVFIGKLRRHDARIDLHVTKMCFVMMVGFIIAWTPYAVECLWAAHVRRISALSSVLPTMFAKSSCMINPVIFLCSSSKFRRDLAKLICRCSAAEEPAARTQPSFYIRQSAAPSSAVGSQAPQAASVYYNKERIYIGEVRASSKLERAELFHRNPDVLSVASSASSDVEYVVKRKPRTQVNPTPQGAKGLDMFLASGVVMESQSSSTSDSKTQSMSSWIVGRRSLGRRASKRGSQSDIASRSSEIFTLEGAFTDMPNQWKM